MERVFKELDRLLRGEHTATEDLRAGRIDIPVSRLAIAALMCGAVFGLCMGVYLAVADGPGGSNLQPISSALKIPLLFLTTLLVTFPSLYVFATLAGSRLDMLPCLSLLVAAVTVDMAVLASFGPVVFFFTLFTKSYAFIVLLNVVFFVVAGAVSLGFLSRAVKVLFSADTSNGSKRRARWVFRVWLLIYGVVGTQMGWVLRPFIGNPDLPFTWFRHHRESNVFGALADLLRDLSGSW
jgi:hypothetical protein